MIGPPTLSPDGRVRARDSGDRFTSIDRVASGVSTEDPNMSRLSQLDCTVTVMFTDIENSTMLAEKYGDTQWMQVLRAHNEIVRKALRTYGGNEIKSQGDGFMLAFPSARRALMCAVAIQQEVDRHGHAYPDQGVRVADRAAHRRGHRGRRRPVRSPRDPRSAHRRARRGRRDPGVAARVRARRRRREPDVRRIRGSRAQGLLRHVLRASSAMGADGRVDVATDGLVAAAASAWPCRRRRS